MHACRSTLEDPTLSLAVANTHDLPSLAGYWSERDIDRRAEIGAFPNAREEATARAARRNDKAALLTLLRLRAPKHFEEARFPRTLAAAAHEFLCRTPAALVGLSFDDLAGEADPVNLPGIPPDRYPSWRRRTRMTMEEVSWNFEVDDTIRCHARRRKPAP